MTWLAYAYFGGFGLFVVAGIAGAIIIVREERPHDG